MSETIRINRLPAITWHRLRMNETEIACPASAAEANWTIEEERHAAASGPSDPSPTETTAGTASTASADAFWSGTGAAYGTWIGSLGIAPVEIHAEPGTEKIVRLHITAEPAGAAVLPVEICAGEDESIHVIMDFAGAGSFLGIRTRIHAAKNAHVKLSQLQLLSADTVFVNDIGGEAADSARIETVQLFLGGAGTYNGTEIGLEGDGSSYEAHVGYIGVKTRRLDFNYNAVHLGKNTGSSMTVNGILRDASQKNFRGTIDFRTGSSGAVGAETEEVLLLGEDVINQTIPLILCAEEDVKGSHGASIGQLDEELLFYLASRGIPEDRAIDLMAGSRIQSIIRELRDETAEHTAAAFLGLDTDEDTDEGTDAAADVQ